MATVDWAKIEAEIEADEEIKKHYPKLNPDQKLYMRQCMIRIKYAAKTKSTERICVIEPAI